MKQYDVIVIGAGPAGYVAAIRCAQLGLKTACIDRWRDSNGNPSLGGTCLNVGCIPSKALLDSSEQFARTSGHLAVHGISVDSPTIDVPTMIARKAKIVKELTGGIGLLFKANKIDSIHGHGRVHGGNEVEVLNPDTGESVERLKSQHVIIATGSKPAELPSLPFDQEHIVDSTGALEFEKIPSKLGIIGAGVIGLELGSVWRRLGSEVVILEALESFLPAADPQVAREALKQFKRQGLDIRLGSKVQSATTKNGRTQVTFESGSEAEAMEVDRLIVAVGRHPVTDQLVGDGAEVEIDARGFVVVDERCETGQAGVYAVGDVVRGPMLAHKASEEGVAVAERIATGHGHIDFNTVPWVIYTAPEIAWVGRTEAQLKADNIAFVSGSFPFAATGRAKAMDDTSGFVKIVADAENDRVLGVHMVGPHVSELIAECVFAMEYQASAEDLARTIHAHPTLAEAVHEAALAVGKRAIHKVNR